MTQKCLICSTRFKPQFPRQTTCSEVCLVNLWDKLPSKTRTKRRGREYAGTLGYKSMSEVKYLAYLSAHRIQAEYETETFVYELPQKKYTPDFIIRFSSGEGEPIFLEYKGAFTGKDRTKMRHVRRCNPDRDIRLVFERPQNKLNRCSKTTYGEWATKNGFTWYKADDLTELMKEIDERKKGKTTETTGEFQSEGVAANADTP